jgi:hypothetical protein
MIINITILHLKTRLMTEQELIQLLQALPPHTKIVGRGYEDGYNDILRLNEVKIKPKADAEWYDGEY